LTGGSFTLIGGSSTLIGGSFTLIGGRKRSPRKKNKRRKKKRLLVTAVTRNCLARDLSEIGKVIN